MAFALRNVLLFLIVTFLIVSQTILHFRFQELQDSSHSTLERANSHASPIHRPKSAHDPNRGADSWSVGRSHSSESSGGRSHSKSERNIGNSINTTVVVEKSQLTDKTSVTVLLPDWARNHRQPNEEEPVVDFTGTHPIIALSEHDFRATSVGDMIQGYGPPMEGTETSSVKGATCETDYGMGLVLRWRSSAASFCGASVSGNSNPSDTKAADSRVITYTTIQSNHAGKGDTLVELNNVVLDTSKFCSKANTAKVVQEFTDSKRYNAHMSFDESVLFGHCAITKTPDKHNFPGWQKEWMNRFTATDDADSGMLECDMWEEVPTFLVQRHGFANMYHGSEDFFNTFLALAILNIPVNYARFMLSDLYPWGGYEGIWKELYRGAAPTFQAWDFQTHYKCKRVCFRKLIMGIIGPASPITFIKGKTACVASPIFRAYKDFVVRGLGLHGWAQAAFPRKPESIVVTYMARRSTSLQAKKRFCDDKYFECKDFEKMGIRKLERTIQNDAELSMALRGLEQESFGGGRKVIFWDLDYNLVSLREQIRFDAQTDVMVGPHGAGLTHAMFMSDRGWLLELLIDNGGGRNHFHNLAHWAGLHYRGISPGNPVNIGTTLWEVRKAINAIPVEVAHG